MVDTIDKVFLNKKWGHRLLKIIFYIISLAILIIGFVFGDVVTTLLIFLGWYVVTNIIYYEGIIYIIYGKHGPSLIRKFYKLLKKSGNILKGLMWFILILVVVILTLKFVFGFTIANSFAKRGNDILDQVKEDNVLPEANKAKQYCNAALLFDSNNFNALKCLAYSFYLNKDYYNTLIYVNKGIEQIRNTDYYLYGLKVMALISNGDEDEATTLCDKYIDKINNGSFDYSGGKYENYKYRFYFFKGLLLSAKGFYEKSNEYYDIVLNSTLDNRIVLNKKIVITAKINNLLALNKYKEASLIIDDYLSKHKDDTDFLKLKEAIPDNIVLNTSSNTSSNNLTPSTTPSNDLEYCQQKWGKLFASRGRTTDGTVICGCKEGYSNNVAGPGVVCEPFADKSKECAISFGDNSKSDGVKCVCKNGYTMSSDGTYCQGPGGETLLEQCQSKWGIHSIVGTTDKKCYCADGYTYSITTSQCDEPFTK